MKPLIFGSVCSGMEAASVAWNPLGWEAAFFSEIDAAASCVLDFRYGSGRPKNMPSPDEAGISSSERKLRWSNINGTRHLIAARQNCPANHGDFTTIRKNDYAPINLLVGGTPCQDFSIAGLRKGIAGDRGHLTLEFLRLADRLRPTWLVWENVPGVLSSDEGRAFGSFLGGLGKLGYGFAYRVLDAQFYGVAQRRRRVFVVGYLGDWRPSAAVLFERESLSGDSAPSREAGESVAGTFSARTSGGGGFGTDFECQGGLIPEIAHTLRSDGFDASEDGSGRGTPLTAFRMTGFGKYDDDDSGGTVKSRTTGHQNGGGHTAIAFPINTQMGLRGADTSNSKREGIGVGAAGDPAFTLQENHGHAVAFGFAQNQTGEVRASEISGTLGTNANASGRNAPLTATQDWGRNSKMAVRRLTPRECERLQGFEDDYTLVPFGKRMMSDSQRYKMIGNSMAVPPMRKIGNRIDMVRNLMGEK